MRTNNQMKNVKKKEEAYNVQWNETQVSSVRLEPKDKNVLSLH